MKLVSLTWAMKWPQLAKINFISSFMLLSTQVIHLLNEKPINFANFTSLITYPLFFHSILKHFTHSFYNLVEHTKFTYRLILLVDWVLFHSLPVPQQSTFPKSIVVFISKWNYSNCYSSSFSFICLYLIQIMIFLLW